MTWCRVDRNNDEYPPENLWVWASDYERVFLAQWIFAGPYRPLNESAWINQSGEFVEVMCWLPVDDDHPEIQPAVPDEPPPISQRNWGQFGPDLNGPDGEGEGWKKGQ